MFYLAVLVLTDTEIFFCPSTTLKDSPGELHWNIDKFKNTKGKVPKVRIEEFLIYFN